MITTILLTIGMSLLISLIILNITLPVKVQYVEEINLNAPVNAVYDAIRYQEQLMQWSAWPKETKSQCAVKNADGKLGAQTVYLKNGKQFGYQEVTDLEENEKVSFYLTSKAPFEQDTRLHFYLKEIADNNTYVMLYFDNTLKKPSHIFPHIFGIIKWTHGMHLKDLAGLKKYVENRE
ncbi:SRPBCC domain-containing protein [Winogradskyella sp.]|uniref:SRPBCC domain-containing protein n=1 Tax=Winogradskyella sp. TaxID=1883156 RepID=UPI0026363928|nr:SRPBCC domain-containing protein [Winogradskyella sp.]